MILGFRFALPQALCCRALRALCWRHKPARVIVIFRDEERGSRVSAAVSRNLSRNSWDLRDLTETPVGMWEPTYDTAAWAAKHELHLFVQNVGQGTAESLEELPPQMISVLEWKPKRAKSR